MPPGNVFDGKPRYGNAAARLWTMRSCDLETWRAPELLREKGRLTAGFVLDARAIPGAE